MWTQGTLNAVLEQDTLWYAAADHSFYLMMDMFSFLSDWDKLLFVLTHLQYWDSLLAIFKSIVTMCKLPHDPKYPLVSSTLKSSLTQHSEFTVIAALSKASWGHHMKSNPACSSTPLPPQLANSAPLLQDSGDLWFLCKTAKIKRPLP